MYLKKIISNGFKSFADKITITLDKTHITGIVGPNGSGKSNVIDAVRWVMGEQNAKMLRGEKATDIIFAGSEKRKPLGMAEVSLVFDNNEGSPFCPPEYRHEPEITLTRRLYIDGQREYFINRKQCRLKDIVSFFTSTGLGGRSYSMIQQGQVDRILQAKPEQIREILEEAAGISIFKQRRNEARKKLEKTQVNLSRIEDIVAEIDRQMETLKEQVEKAEKWQGLTADLRHKELSLFGHNHLLFKQKEQEIRTEIEENTLKEVACVEQISVFEEKYDELKQVLSDSDPELNALAEEITVLREKIASSEASLLSVDQLLENGDNQLAAFDADLKEEQESLERSEQELTAVSDRLSDAEKELEDIDITLESLNESFELSQEESLVYNNKINDLGEELRNLERFLENNKIRREAIEKDYSRSSKIMHEHTEKLLNLEEEYSHAQIIVEGMSIKRGHHRKGLEKETEEKNKLEVSIKQRSEKIKQEKEKHDKLKGKYLEAKARLSSLIEIDKNSEDVLGIIKKLRSEDQLDTSLPLLTDYIGFAPSFNTLPPPVKSSFERWAEKLLVQNTEHLGVVCKTLNEKKVGGVAAYILEPTADATGFEDLAASYGLISLSQHLLIEEELTGLSSCLNTLFYYDREEIPLDLSQQIPNGVTIFTSSGLAFSSNRDIVIGASSEQGALSRKETIEKLRQDVDSLAHKLGLWEEKISGLENKSNEEAETLSQLDKTIFQKNQDLLELTSELKTKEIQLLHLKEQIGVSKKEYASLEEACDQYGSELEELNSSDLALSQEFDQTKLSLEDARLDADNLKDQAAEMGRQLEQKKIEHASVKSMAHTLKEHYERDQLQVAQLSEKLKKKEEERIVLKTKIDESLSRQNELTQDIEGYIYRREELEEKLNVKKETNAGLLEELQVIENRLKEARDLSSKAQKSVSEKGLELERVRLGIEGALAQAQEKYHIDLKDYDFEVIEDFDASSETRKVSALRNKIESMGLINMMAIDEYKELTERHEFMSAQKNEVVSSVNLLELAIEEIEEKSQNKFMDTFTTLNREFSELFPILFPRGEAQITLTDADNPLEAGVEIMVRLPGKNRQNMRLFSGGEKALTAIALIFALLKSKPTPFCFLDEVDAPLDETNVSRYNNVLNALADKFQFIVITHRRRTMEVLDTLYGVTMQEPGVSKVVGVDMSKALPSHLQKAFKEEKRQGASAY
ncbi:MAG: chromosome segregation protein SMC [Oligoflexales bacterium]|nr:chromosome segregation protein SMC [Oligoflexales bacterium]